MTDLIDRLSGESEQHDPPRPSIGVHAFGGRLRLYADGTMAAAEVIADNDLQGDELTQANLLVTELDGKNALLKIAYIMRVEGIVFLMQDSDDTKYHNPDGTIKKAQVAADLDLV